MTGELDGRVALVTGALGKLGPVWIDALRGAGAHVVGADLREADGVYAADVTDRDAVLALRDRVEDEHGRVEILVNNAGIDQPPTADAGAAAVEEIAAADFARVLDVNVGGTFACTQVFGARMRDAGGGSIVNIGSLYASIAPEPAFYDHIPGFLKPPAYGASKAAVVNLTRYFARLWGPHGVRVNALSPGGVLGGQDGQFLAKFTARTPLRRLAEDADLTGPLLFLASDASRYVTGHELRVDGGFTA
jgi:NAD(P)-dependent dehydrogenase (short-subunit alcohol dehydrogenase family)